MKLVSTEGNGGPPIVLSREPVPKPPIWRGLCSILHSEHDQHFEDGTSTWMQRIRPEGWSTDVVITYHRAIRTAFWDLAFEIEITPETVVTWEYVQ